MTWNPTRVRRHLQNRTFAPLFIEELGWDNLAERLSVDVDGTRYLLESVAHKRGVVAFVHRAGDALPDSRIRRKIETQVARSHREHVIIYSDGPGTQQVWQWVRREAGKPLSNREHRYDSHQSGESLIQKLEAIRFSLDEEDDLTLTDVVGSVRAAFNVERATKKFYTEFKRQHDAFQKFLQGIPNGEMERWYVSVMLNRLMFLYFIQKKGFLTGDRDYLRTKLSASQSRGEDGYYRDFLCPLFFEGFAKPKEQRTAAINALLGDIPYLNGGIFQQHQVEQLHGRTIAIPDRAFDRLFDFFDSYQWHLDDRPLRDDREINPDVLGYIFEQYINQKQMGAYYTKEDITDYIGKNTIIPFLFDRAQKEYPDGFRGPNGAWALLERDPARYIYPAVAKGVELPLPPEIAAGLDDVSQRGEWNTPTPEEYALPTEIWRETVARRQRYAEVQGKLERGEVQSINDLITLNLDIRQFAQDVIEQSERPETVRAFWKALTGVSVLDPTCGSGAFLFAALNILEPLYEAALARMQAFVGELGPEDSARRFKDFRDELAQVARHPNQKYFVYKSIVVNNLYGVDIMAEATEIAKLRLFLKLVAQVEEVSKLEPLPDIDFNIRAGNTLVGFATYADVEETVRGDRLLLLPEDEELLAQIREEAEAVERLFGRFRAMQTTHDVREWGDDYATSKAILTHRLKALDERLNRLLAQQYGIDPDKLEYEGWRSSHQPFHWFVEFYGILKAGGFDVVIGNPPYVEYRIIRQDYQLREGTYQSIDSANLYAFCMERSTQLIRDSGRFGMIVPTSVIGLDKTDNLRQVLVEHFRLNICSTYGIRPSKLFEGVDQRLCIYLAHSQSSQQSVIQTTRHHYWYSDERSNLFGLLEYNNTFNHNRLSRFPQIANSTAGNIFQKIEALGTRTINHCFSPGKTGHLIHYHRSPRYWIRSIDFEPHFKSATRSRSVFHFRDLLFVSASEGKAVGALLNSSLFYLWFVSMGNGRNITGADIEEFPIGKISDENAFSLGTIFDSLMLDYKAHSVIRVRADQEYQEFDQSKSKPIMDQIDSVLARHYGFSDEELDYIINYDIKYRMGDELFTEEEGEG